MSAHTSATPKSEILMTPFGITIILDGLISLCTIDCSANERRGYGAEIK